MSGTDPFTQPAAPDQAERDVTGERETGDSLSLVRHEEEASVGKEWVTDGVVTARKTVESRVVDESVPRFIEYAEAERVKPSKEDSGKIEMLPDGSVSIPVLEEQIVVTRRTVVRERIIIRKSTQTVEERVTAELRREHVIVESEGPIEVRDTPAANGESKTRPFPGTER
jgi:uncharacterized protein (TIGR02271 family)